MDDTSRPSPANALSSQQESLGPIRRLALPEDVDALARMRDQLAKYLETIEANTKTLSDWMNTNKETIVLGYHRLSRAIGSKNEAEALTVIRDLGATAGFVLSIDDFKASGAEAFGGASAFVTELGNHASPYPQGLLEDLPDVADKNANFLSPDVPDAPELNVPQRKEEKKEEKKGGAWSFVKNAFRDEAAEKAEAQKVLDEKMAKWRAVRDEMLRLNSNKHYFLDSLMGYIGRALDETTPPDVDPEIMLDYKHPQYTIDYAREDFEAVRIKKSTGIREMAADYAAVANLFEKATSADDMIAAMERLHTGANESREEFMRKVLFKDMGIASFAEYALTRIADATTQAAVFNRAVALEKNIVLTKQTTPAAVFELVLSRVLGRKDPLDPSTLASVQSGFGITTPDKLAASKIDVGYTMNRIITRFSDDPAKTVEALAHLLSPSLGGTDTTRAVTGFVNLTNAFRANDAQTVHDIFSNTAQSDILAIKGLWQLTHGPQDSLLDATARLLPGAGPAAGQSALYYGIDNGWYDELRLTKTSSLDQINKTLNFFEKNLLPGRFGMATAQQFLSTAFKDTGVLELRERLSGKAGASWLSSVMSRQDLTGDEKLAWAAFMLNPLKNNFERANTVFAAARKVGAEALKAPLEAMEKSFFGENVRVGNSYLVNLKDAVCIWAEPEKGGKTATVKICAGSKHHTLAENVAAAEANEMIEVISRRGPFVLENGTALNLNKVDKLIYKDRETVKGGQVLKDTGIAFTRGRSNENDLRVSRNNPDLNNPSNADRKFIIIEADGKKKTGKNDKENRDRTAYNIDALAVIKRLNPNEVAEDPDDMDDPDYPPEYTLMMDALGDYVQAKGKVSGAFKNKDVFKLDDGTFINLRNASMIQINWATNKIGIRIESEEFERCRQYTNTKGSFFEIETSAQVLRDIATALKANPQYASHTDRTRNSGQEIFFNFEKLGYMMLDKDQEDNYGFITSAAGGYEESTFIKTAGKQSAVDIFTSMSRNKNLIVLGQTIFNPDSVLQAYFNYKDGSFHIMTTYGTDKFEGVPQRTALDILNTLCTQFGFVPAQAVNLSGSTRPAFIEVINPRKIAAVDVKPSDSSAEMCSESVRLSTGMPAQTVRNWTAVMEAAGKSTLPLAELTAKVAVSREMPAECVVQGNAQELLKGIKVAAEKAPKAPQSRNASNDYKDTLGKELSREELLKKNFTEKKSQLNASFEPKKQPRSPK